MPRKTEAMFAMPVNHLSDEPVELTPDSVIATTSAINQIYDALSFVDAAIKSKSLTKSIRYNGLKAVDNQLKRVKNLLGAEEDDLQDKELEVSLVRMANDENHRLRAEMAKGVTDESIGLRLNALTLIVYKWWKSLGFGYCESSFSAHSSGGSMKIRFSAHVDKHGEHADEDTHLTSKIKRMEIINELGKHVDMVITSGDMYIADSPKSRKYLEKTLKARFPGIRIYEWRSLSIHGSEKYHIRDIEAYIPIEDINGL